MDDNPYLFETIYYRRAKDLIDKRWREGYEVSQMTCRGDTGELVILFVRRMELSFA